MNKKDIIQDCQTHCTKFLKILEHNPYQIRGMFNSELLLIVSLIKKYGVKQIIESGRARGHSTKIISDFFDTDDYSIVSIDFDANSTDSKYGAEQLKKYSNLKLVYGDANVLIADNITQPCAIIIDGPKGEDAIILATKLLENKMVKFICIHDLHKTTFERDIFDLIFKDTVCSDDEEYVEAFRFLDADCWDQLKKYGEEPYRRNGKENYSYASTIAVVFNSNEPLHKKNYENYREYYYSKKKISLAGFLSSCLGSNSYIIKFLRKIYFLLK